jgi:hypothetical protein
MAAWHRRYNVSGTVHLGERVEDWCRVLRGVLRTEEVGTLGHFTGAVSVLAFSPVADVVSCGFEVHEFLALAHGEGKQWLRFAAALESALTTAALPYALVVHDRLLARSRGRS